MEVRRPTLADKETILDMIEEFKRENSAMDGGFFDKALSYEDWLLYNEDTEIGLNLPAGFVPAIQLVSFDETGRALGFISVRLRLNDYLLNIGGHIGYSIRPSERRKGYAHQQLQEGLKVAREKNIKEILITCEENNVASDRVIQAAGGQLEDVRAGVKRYWIK